MAITTRLWSMLQVAAVVFVCVVPLEAAHTILVGPVDQPTGIDGLHVTYSGGSVLFDVRFDERSFDDAFGAGSPVLPFLTEADGAAALSAVGDFLDLTAPLASTGAGPGFDGSLNSLLFTPRLYNETGFTEWTYIDGFGGAGWDAPEAFGGELPRDLPMSTFGVHTAWAVFTPAAIGPDHVPVPGAMTLTLMGVIWLAGFNRRRGPRVG